MKQGVYPVPGGSDSLKGVIDIIGKFQMSSERCATLVTQPSNKLRFEMKQDTTKKSIFRLVGMVHTPPTSAGDAIPPASS